MTQKNNSHSSIGVFRVERFNPDRSLLNWAGLPTGLGKTEVGSVFKEAFPVLERLLLRLSEEETSLESPFVHGFRVIRVRMNGVSSAVLSFIIHTKSSSGRYLIKPGEEKIRPMFRRGFLKSMKDLEEADRSSYPAFESVYQIL